MVGARSLSAPDTDAVCMLVLGGEVTFGCCRNIATVTQTNSNTAMAGKATRQFNRAKYAAKISLMETGFTARNLPATFRWKLSDA